MVREASSRTFFHLLNLTSIQRLYFMFIYTMKLKIDPLISKHINLQHVIMLDGATAQPQYEDITLRYYLCVCVVCLYQCENHFP